MRGVMNNTIQNEAKNFLNREIDTSELRFYPYLDYCIKNGASFDLQKMDGFEIGLVNDYCMKGYLKITDEGKIAISKPFYQYIQEILWLSYVEYKVENNE